MMLFKARKEGDPDKNQVNSVLWCLSRDHHEGSLKTATWEVKITSSHKSALERQIMEAMGISKVGTGSLLNSKNKFGSNNIPEIAL